MEFDDRPQLPLTPRRIALVALGFALFAAQVAVAWYVARVSTGEGIDGSAALAMIACSVPISVAATLLLVRQADLPDIATAAFIVTISPYAAFTLSAAFAVRGTTREVDLVDALFLGVTTGALMALVVWGCAMAVARLLRLPTTQELSDAG